VNLVGGGQIFATNLATAREKTVWFNIPISS